MSPNPHGFLFNRGAALSLPEKGNISSSVIYPHLTFAFTPLNQVLTRTSLNGAINQLLCQGTFPCLWKNGNPCWGSHTLKKTPLARHPEKLSRDETPGTLSSSRKTQVRSSRQRRRGTRQEKRWISCPRDPGISSRPQELQGIGISHPRCAKTGTGQEQ